MRLPDPIGGYFELEMPCLNSFPYGSALKFQSARAAFYALLIKLNPKRVWMPAYTCDVMFQPLQATNTEWVLYDIKQDLSVESTVDLAENEILIYVNYFGVCDHNVVKLLSQYPPDQIVLDYSHAFYSEPVNEALATLYSPRKFFGVPDGGLLITNLYIDDFYAQDSESINRTAHLIKRLGDSPEVGYFDYKTTEEAFIDCRPKRMSLLSEKILSSIDFQSVKAKRAENFRFLCEELNDKNHLSIDLSCADAPLCYPFLVDKGDGLRSRMIEERVFIPKYWPDALDRVCDRSVKDMIVNLLPLPIDHRYGRKEMERIVSLIRSANL